jgi:glutathione S-transferase
VTFSNQTEALMTKLYWAPRTRSLRALWVLEEAGVPYERVRLDLSAGEHKSADYCAINPMAKVPALTDGPVAIAESGAICAYVAEAHPEAGLAPPVGDPARGRYLRWLFFSPGCVEQAFLVKSYNVPVRRGSLANEKGLLSIEPRHRPANRFQYPQEGQIQAIPQAQPPEGVRQSYFRTALLTC